MLVRTIGKMVKPLKRKFNDNKKEGLWTYFHENGEKYYGLNYKKGKFQSGTFFDEKGVKEEIKIDKEDLIDKSKFIGGHNAMLEIINKKIANRVEFEAPSKSSSSTSGSIHSLSMILPSVSIVRFYQCYKFHVFFFCSFVRNFKRSHRYSA